MSLLRHDFESLASVTDEIDSLLGLVGVEKVKQLDPLKGSDLGKISRQIGTALKRAVAGGEAAAMKAALNELNVDWANLSATARTRVVEAARRQAKKVIIDKTLPKINQVFTANVKPIYGSSKAASIAKHSLQINFSLSSQDADIARFVADSQSNFITNQYGQRLARMSTNVRSIVADGTKRGAGSAEIVKDLYRDLPSISNLGRGQFYWEVVAMSFTNRARNYAGIASYGEAGIEWYLWESVLDEVTTETCRFLHGKRFSTGDELSRFQSLEENTENPEAIKQIQPWVSIGRNADGEKSLFFRGAEGQKRHIATVIKPGYGKADIRGTYSAKMSDKQLSTSGISMPPIHGMCRSTTVPDVSGPSPRFTPEPPAERPAPVPTKKPEKIPRASEPKVGNQFEKFASDMSKADEKVMMRTIDDLGMTEFLEKNKIGRLVFSEKIGRMTRLNTNLAKGTGGVSYAPMIGKNVKEQKSVVKVLSKGNKFGNWEFKEGVRNGWSVSESMKTERGATQTILAHELGHFLTDFDVRVKKIGRKLFVDQAATPENYMKVRNIMKTSFANRAKNPSNAVSLYAQTNPDEYFAESFAAHAVNPTALKARDPVAFEMVEEVRKIRGLKPVKRAIDGN